MIIVIGMLMGGDFLIKDRLINLFLTVSLYFLIVVLALVFVQLSPLIEKEQRDFSGSY